MKNIISLLLLFLFISSCNESNPLALECEEGFTDVEGECVEDCDEGLSLVDGECVLICSEGFSAVDGECIADSLCESTEVEINGACYNIESTTELGLGGQGLSGSIPAEIGNLTNLTTIDLSYNSFTGPIPPEIGNLTNLETLRLNDNNLSGEIPPEIGGLTSLQNLFLYNNDLTGAIPAEIGLLTNLANVNLAINQLTEIPPEIGNLTNVQSLQLNINQIAEVPDEIENMSSLVDLKLAHNQLAGEIPAGILNLTNLTALELTNNQLTGEIPAAIGNLVNLTSLKLQDNDLSGSISVELGNLTNLNNLDLSANQLSGEIPSELGNLANLGYLRLQNNQLSGEIPVSLGNLMNIFANNPSGWSFNLSYNELSGIIPEEICSLLVTPYVANNNFCAPYPDCGEGAITSEDQQDTSGCSDDVSLSLATTETEATISYTSGSDITEFMFTVSGVTMTGTSSGLEINQYSNQTGAVLGNSPFTNAVLPAGSGTLVTITFEPLTSSGQISINGISVSSSSGSLTVVESSLESALTYTDCTGVVNGLAVVDECGVCDGPGLDCAGACNENVELWGECYNIDETTYLELEGSGLTENIPSEIGNLTNLSSINLSQNQLAGEISMFGNLTNLQVLELDNNQLTGEIPPEIGDMTNLRILSLYDNQLTGEIPPEIGNCQLLHTLRLDYNQLTGEIPASLGNLTSVNYSGNFSVNNNELSGFIPEEICNAGAELQVYYNNLCPPFPDCISSSQQIYQDMTNCPILGCMDDTACNYNSNAEHDDGSCEYVEDCLGECGGDAVEDECGVCDGPGLDCYSQCGEHVLIGSFCYNLDLTFLELNNQGFTEFPPEIFSFTNLEHLTLRDNQITEIPPEISNLSSLITLNLEGNLITEIPPEIGALTNLLSIHLKNNQITQIADELFNLTSLTYLYLGINQLSDIPSGIGNLTNLTSLNLSNNNLTGSIPSWIGNLTQLEYLMLNVNGLTESIPAEIGSLVNIEHLYLDNNELSGEIPSEIGNLTLLGDFRLHNNNLSGEVPSEIANMSSLQSLYLDDNDLSGVFPEEICDMSSLYYVHIENNQLCAPYPNCISQEDQDSQDTSGCEDSDSITLWSQGTNLWPDQACNSITSFGMCNTNDQSHADAWATYVCQLNGYDIGVWTGNKEAGCNGSISMHCQDSLIPCEPAWENVCYPNDQTKVEITCSMESR